MHRLLILGAFLATTAASVIAVAAECEKKFTRPGPLDKHAALTQGVLDTLDLSDDQNERLAKIVAESHADWRNWFQKNEKKVDHFANAVREAKQGTDKEKLKKILKQKKTFMHTAPSILRYPEPIHPVLTDAQRKLFDERLQKLKADLHKPRKKPAKPAKPAAQKKAPQKES